MTEGSSGGWRCFIHRGDGVTEIYSQGERGVGGLARTLALHYRGPRSVFVTFPENLCTASSPGRTRYANPGEEDGSIHTQVVTGDTSTEFLRLPPPLFQICANNGDLIQEVTFTNIF